MNVLFGLAIAFAVIGFVLMIASFVVSGKAGDYSQTNKQKNDYYGKIGEILLYLFIAFVCVGFVLAVAGFIKSEMNS